MLKKFLGPAASSDPEPDDGKKGDQRR